MRELNPVGREDNVLLLVSSDGEQFTVSIDETLTRTLKEHRVPDSSGEQLTPRQIQDAIRAGESITEISERSGTRLSLVERFAHPVLEELQHMVDLALSIRVELPADRFNEVAKKPFGEVIEENLVTTGATGIEWFATRSENSIWEISVRYILGEETGSATWTFDPRRYQLTPETSNAQSLSRPGNTIDSPLRSAPKSVSPEHPSNGEPVVTADNLEAFRSRRAKIDAISEPEPVEVIELKPETEFENIAEVVQITQVVEVVPNDLGEENQDAPDLLTEPEHEPEIEVEDKPIAEAPKKTRAPMPSWDQIVRGTQSDDGDAF